MFWFIPQSHYSVYFSVHFVSQRMSLKYMKGLHLPISDPYIYQKSHLQIVGKTLYIVASSIIFTYDVDKTNNGTLKIPWFHTIASHSSQNRHDTMGKIAKKKLETIDSFRIFGGSSLPISCLEDWLNTISRKLPVKATPGVHFIHPKVGVWMTVNE